MKTNRPSHELRRRIIAVLLSTAAMLVAPPTQAVLPTLAPSDALVFADDFDANTNGWSNIGAATTQATIGPDPQMPAVSAWYPNGLTSAPSYPGCFSVLTLNAPPNLWQGAVSVYMRARVWTPPPAPNQVGENNKFILVLSEDNGTGNPLLPTTASNALGQLIVKPSLESTRWSQIGYADLTSAGVVTNQLLYNLPPLYLFSATNYVDYRLTLWATNDDASMTMIAQRYNPDLQAWEQLGTPAPKGLVASGNFNLLQLVSRNAANGSARSNNCRAFFDSVAVTYYPFTNLPPSSTWYVENVTPARGVMFAAAAAGLSFNVTARAPNSVPQSAIQLFLNGQEVTGSATTSGNNTNWRVAYNGLQENRLYTARVVLTDGQGAKRVKEWGFGTFAPAAVSYTELEDYNFGLDGVCGGDPVNVTLPTAGGNFYDPTGPNQFSYLTGLPGADYFSPVAYATMVNAYRPCDLLGARATKDALREWYQAGATDYDLNNVAPGAWANYTRSATAGVYRVFLRAAAQQPQPAYLDRVIGETRLPNQTTQPLGQFQATAGGDATYDLLSLKDVAGNDALVSLADTNTLRLTLAGQHGTFYPNFLMFFPATAPLPPVIARVEPLPGSTQVERHAPLSVVIGEGQSSLNLTTLGLWLDGTNVTASTTNSYVNGTLSVGYVPPAWFAPGSTHTVTVVVADNSAPALVASNLWSFTVLDRVTSGALRINFQKGGRATPAGFLADTGQVFDDRGNGYSYGWDATNTSWTVERLSPASPSPAHDTFILLNPQATNSRVWEIAMPAGRYGVFGVAGDPGEFTSNFRLALEGNPFLSGVPTPLNPWVSGYSVVDLSDGRLTLAAQNYANNKINFLEITPVVELGITASGFSGAGFSLSFPTQPRRLYRVQYATSAGAAWQTAGVVVGDGSIKSFTDSAATGDTARFYRVVAE